MIHIHASRQLFSLESRNASYIIGLHRSERLLRYHFGKKMDLPARDTWFIEYPSRATEVLDLSLEDYLGTTYYPVEFSLSAGGDFRPSSLAVRDSEGYPITDFIYESFEKNAGVTMPEGYPGLQIEATEGETLRLMFTHKGRGLHVILSYAVIPSHDVFLRWMRVENNSHDTFTVDRAMSATTAFPEGNWDLITLDGAHAREKQVNRTPVRPGITSVGSNRGISAHGHTPYVILADRNTDEFHGDCYALSLIHSGDFLIESDLSDDEKIRINVGVHPDTTRYVLSDSDVFDTPAAYLTYSPDGLNALSQLSHRWVTDILMNTTWSAQERPVLLNSWEAAYFDFDEARLIDIAGKAKELGVELFVLDDGWFGKRNNDHCSLGDWYCNMEKLPSGIGGLSERIHSLGLKFGIWVEPEMISVDSDLYRAHQDWCLHVPGERRLEGRHQLLLDLSRQDVQENILMQLRNLFDSARIEYVKWDMNRYFTNSGSALPPLGRKGAQGEIPLRFTQGLYRILSIITSEYPDILFEGCASGGGRFDYAMMPFFPQYWTSDNTDAVSRMKIQYGTSFMFPPVAMGSHVSDVPGHQVGRMTPMLLRSMVSMGGNYGLELDPAKLSQTDYSILKDEIAWYKRHREILQKGTFTRLLSPFEGDRASWIITDAEKREAVGFYFVMFSEGNQGSRRWKLAGLDPERMYTVEFSMTGREYSDAEHVTLPTPIRGDELMNRGIDLPPFERDYSGVRILLRS